MTAMSDRLLDASSAGAVPVTGRGRATRSTQTAWIALAPALRRRRCDAARRSGATRGSVHMALLRRRARLRRASSRLRCRDGRFPSVGALIRRRSGWSARSATCTASSRVGCRTAALARPRRWGVGAAGDAPTAPRPAPTPSCRPRARALHQIPVGPVHAGIIEPGHFRFTANGETVVRLEQRLGYVHKGIEGLMHRRRHRARRRGSPARISGDSTVAYALRLRPRRRGGARRRRRRRAPCWLRGAHGGAGAPRQPPRRYRRDLQRRVVRAACTPHCGILRERVLRGGGRLLRPPADDGPHRAGRRRAPTSPPTAPRAICGAAATRSQRPFAELVAALRQHRLAAGPHRRHRHRRRRSWRGSSAPAAMSAAPRAATFDARRTLRLCAL